MKKLLLSVFTLVTITSSVAQVFTGTTYRGAFAPAPTPMWTQGWAEWDPQNKIYPAPTVTVNTNITANTTWATGQTVLLQGPIYVKGNSVLTIQPGVVVLGSKAVAGSALIVTKGSQLVAIGNTVNPIVFCSDQAPGARSVGDWGGIILLGSAALNYTNGINNVEGLPVSVDSEFGGGATPNNNDNSGSLQYLRIEFGGYVYQPNKEINGLTLGAVGKATTLKYIQTSFTNDDGFEWFGGNVDAKYLVSYRNLDDDFDTDNGYSGNVQFGLIVRDPNLADNPTVSTSEGFESDNDANGTTATPLTSGIFSNITMVGPFRGANTNTIASGYRRAVRIRRTSNLKIYNSIFMDTQRGVHVDGTNCEIAAGNGGLKFKHNIVAGTAIGKTVEQNAANSFATNAGSAMNVWFGNNGNDSILNSSPSFSNILTTPYNYTSPDYRPGTGSPALATASFTDPVIAPLTGFTGYTEVKKEIGYVALYPNPASDITSLIINSNIDSDISVNVMDVTGKLVLSVVKDLQIFEGTNELTINTQNLTNGVYFVTLNTKLGKETVKLVVSK
ncbi:MAG: T9SS type A sorting domain-containing protein [Bacteroidota bacterium]|nr:T9SS type A sorting domain-containing protein [Bacteroidota bacterium]